MVKSIKLYVHGPSPNPVKVAIFLEELGIPYDSISETKIKEEPFISLNPNGRLPAIEDPNTGIVVFESGAILEYLSETYDKENKFTYTSGQEKWLQKSFLHFQMSGQGPYFGQLAFFKFFHPHKNLAGVNERYENEIKRVSGVIDAHLKKKGTPYLIGDKLSYVDLAFIPWFRMVTGGAFITIEGWKPEEELPTFWKWISSLIQRPSVQTVVAKKEFQRD